jgi:hypothetical protein
MLAKQINEFIDYCKVSGFKDKSIKKAPFPLLNVNNALFAPEKFDIGPKQGCFYGFSLIVLDS